MINTGTNIHLASHVILQKTMENYTKTTTRWEPSCFPLIPKYGKETPGILDATSDELGTWKESKTMTIQINGKIRNYVSAALNLLVRKMSICFTFVVISRVTRGLVPRDSPNLVARVGGFDLSAPWKLDPYPRSVIHFQDHFH
jgi:hypothetical protein